MRGRIVFLLVAFTFVLAVVACTQIEAQQLPRVRRRPVLRVLVPASQRVIVPFTLTAQSPTFTHNFVPVKDGLHTAAANWASRDNLTLQVRPSGATAVSNTGGPPRSTLECGVRGEEGPEMRDNHPLARAQ